MNKEQFLKELNHNLRYLTKEARDEEIKEYESIDDYNLNPRDVANEIYTKRGLNYHINEKMKFLDAVNILVENLRKNDKETTKSILLFFLYLLILVIFIKVPFIYVRDILGSIINSITTNNTIMVLWHLSFELIYALTGILIFIKQIKSKAETLEK